MYRPLKFTNSVDELYIHNGSFYTLLHFNKAAKKVNRKITDPVPMIIKGNGKENCLHSKFKVTVENKNKVTFAFQESSTFHTCKLQRSRWPQLGSAALSKNSIPFHDKYIFSQCHENI